MSERRNVTVELSGASAAAAVATASVSLRTNFTVTHAISAAQLARQATVLERTAAAPGPVLDEIRAVATGAIMVSVAFLEGTVNQFFLDQVEDAVLDEWKTVLGDRERNLSTRLWETAGLERLPALAKYDAALEILGGPALKGTHHYQGAALVNDVRNALVHARPVTHSDVPAQSTADAVKLSRCLRDQFAPNRFVGNNAAFPDGVLGGGGARWAFTRCLGYTDEFFARIGVKPRYEPFRDRLRLEDPRVP